MVTDCFSHNRRRQVKNVDFGLTFPVISDIPQPAQQAISSQPTPQSSQPLNGRAPAISKSGPLPGAIVPEINPPTSRNTSNDANISAKRRKLNSDQTPSASARTTRSSLHPPRQDNYTLPEDENEQAAATIGSGLADEEVERDELEIRPQLLSPGSADTAPLTEVVAESPANAPGSGNRMRVSLNEAASQSLRLQESLLNSSPAVAEHVNSSPVLKRKRRVGEATPKSSVPSTKRSSRHKTEQENDDELDELSPDQPRGRGRKWKDSDRGGPRNSRVAEDVAQHSAEEAEEIDDKEAAAILKKSRGRGRLSIPAAASPDLDVPTPVVTKKKRGRPSNITAPAQQRQPKRAPQYTKAKSVQKTAPKTSKKSTTSSKVRVGSPIPITVHRFTKRQLYDDEDPDADILNAEIPYIKRAGVNAIDVLSQVCHEIIESGLDTLAEGGSKADDPALRREYKTKWTAVEAFGRELQNRLLEHVSLLPTLVT
jgi:hypothetical protein